MSKEADGELKATVEELQATVRGLTEELVEANERIRVLEEKVEDGAEEADPSDGEEAKSPESQNNDNDSDESTLGDDIIVA